jgi:hypothetical protein
MYAPRVLRRRAARLLVHGFPAVVVAVALSLLAGCDGLFRSSKVRLLAEEENRRSAFCPVWSPDGKTVYYLQSPTFYTYEQFGGRLMSVSSDGADRRTLLDGTFGQVAISPDGARLLLTTGKVYPGGRLVLVDTAAQRVDSVAVPPDDTVTMARFGARGDQVYFSAKQKGIFRLDLGSLDLDTVIQLPQWGVDRFDVWRDSLIRLWDRQFDMARGTTDGAAELRCPAYAPQDARVVAGVAGRYRWLNTTVDISVANSAEGTAEYLNASPSYSADIKQLCWSPDGAEIVFAAADVPNPDNPPTQYRLWIVRR